ncbi:MAG: ABC transporter permease [Clostridia bacterium]|nr:ABC transporter permease [Clostridia bacterium]
MSQEKWSVEITAARKGLGLRLSELWRYRDLIYLLARRSFVAMYKQTILGPAWAILQPLLTTGVFTLVFGMLVGIRTEGPSMFLFYMCGSVAWNFFSRCLEKTAQTFADNERLYSKVYFPRLCAPIATVLVTFISFLIQFVFFLCFLIVGNAVKHYGIQVDWGLIALTPAVLIEMALLGMGVGIGLSALTVRYKDLTFLVGFGVSLWMYISPVAYPTSVLSGNYPALKTLFMLNPMTPIIEFFRSAYLGSGSFRFLWWYISLIETALLLVLGVFLFQKVEKTFADVI